MRWLGKGRLRFLQGQSGIALLEILLAVGILAFIGVAFLSALSTTSRSTDIYDEQVTASVLAQSQLEEIKAMAYDPAAPTNPDVYPVIVTSPSGYHISISELEVVPGKQEVTVTVSRGGHTLVQLTTIKANW